MSRAVLSVGSNLGDRLAHLRVAVTGLGDRLLAASPVYETEPWGVTDQPDFLNAVLIAADDSVDEWGWLDIARELERRAGRMRDQRWGPRTLDVDVVTVDVAGEAVRSEHPNLVLPHPGAASRATVLVPWLAVEPNADLPGHGKIAALLPTLDLATVRFTPENLRHP